jgi:hypothetical protein
MFLLSIVYSNEMQLCYKNKPPKIVKILRGLKIDY